MTANLQHSAPTLKLVFTEAAARKVMGLIDEEGDPSLNLRVYITGGGCSGFQYGFTFDPLVNADDLVLEKALEKADDEDGGDGSGGGPRVINADGLVLEKALEKADDEDGGDGSGGGLRVIKLLVDPMSLQYLHGAEIDYREDVNGSQFVIRNPNAKTTCGCGSSFSA